MQTGTTEPPAKRRRKRRALQAPPRPGPRPSSTSGAEGYRSSCILDFERRASDEERDVPAVDDHGVAASPLELLNLVRRRMRQVGDRELPRRNRRQQIEHDLERRLVVFGL